MLLLRFVHRKIESWLLCQELDDSNGEDYSHWNTAKAVYGNYVSNYSCIDIINAFIPADHCGISLSLPFLFRANELAQASKSHSCWRLFLKILWEHHSRCLHLIGIQPQEKNILGNINVYRELIKVPEYSGTKFENSWKCTGDIKLIYLSTNKQKF